MKNIYLVLLASFLPIFAFGAPRQSDNCARPDNPHLDVPPIVYHSPFLNYQSQRTLKLQSWEKANQAVTNQTLPHSHCHYSASEKN